MAKAPRIAWRAITDNDVECLKRDYNLTITELKILKMRRKGESPIAIGMEIRLQKSQVHKITADLSAKIMKMYQDRR